MPGAVVHSAASRELAGSIGTMAVVRSKTSSRGGSMGLVRTWPPRSVVHWA